MSLYEFTTYDNDLKKSQKFKSKAYFSIGHDDCKLEEKMEITQKIMQKLALQHNSILFTTCLYEGHKKVSFYFDDHRQYHDGRRSFPEER